MGHITKTEDFRCDILDELEAAVTMKRTIKVYFEDGSHRTGLAKDVYTENHEDFLQLENHKPIAVSMITRVEQV
jgi:transcriptional antiterminator Rof (Rho-off)